MKTIIYAKGDATAPVGSGNKIIIHICNDIGGWGKGFVMAISKRWLTPEQAYRAWYKSKDNFTLGEIQLVQVSEDTYVANMIAQHKISKDEKGLPPIRYEAVKTCLDKVAVNALDLSASVHSPRIGCGLAGGTWDKIEPLMIGSLSKMGVEVTVYDF